MQIISGTKVNLRASAEIEKVNAERERIRIPVRNAGVIVGVVDAGQTIH